MDIQNILLKPITTEKSTIARSSNVYTFLVHPDANKIMIKNAVEKLFEVKVKSINISIKKPKKKSHKFGRIIGYTNSKKKALVMLEKDNKIAELEV